MIIEIFICGLGVYVGWVVRGKFNDWKSKKSK